MSQRRPLTSVRWWSSKGRVPKERFHAFEGRNRAALARIEFDFESRGTARLKGNRYRVRQCHAAVCRESGDIATMKLQRHKLAHPIPPGDLNVVTLKWPLLQSDQRVS
jgi:hypothetical protein